MNRRHAFFIIFFLNWRLGFIKGVERKHCKFHIALFVRITGLFDDRKFSPRVSLVCHIFRDIITPHAVVFSRAVDWSAIVKNDGICGWQVCNRQKMGVIKCNFTIVKLRSKICIIVWVIPFKKSHSLNIYMVRILPMPLIDFKSTAKWKIGYHFRKETIKVRSWPLQRKRD